MSRVGGSAHKDLVGGSPIDHSGDLEASKTRGDPPTLQRAVVIDVIADPFDLTEEELEALGETVNNAELADVMPANAIIARITSNEGGQTPLTNTILFPFFSCHIQLPIKPGETVYVIYEDYSNTGAKLGYWFTRASNQGTVEDANYTHHDRKFDPTSNPNNYETADKAESNAEVPGPGFPNGGNTPESATLQEDTSAPARVQPFDQIAQNAKAQALTIREAVPRFRKRPGDFAVQGSNNTLICLGEDRTSGLEDDRDIKGGSGTIDIVVGRGRQALDPDTPPPATGPGSTAARVVENSRGELETEKAPYRKGFGNKDNPNEGHLDYKTDAARLYVSMQTNADENFELGLNGGSLAALPELSGPIGSSFVVAKADHIRFIARKSGPDETESIAGTVLLIREGASDEDLGYFFIDENGNIHIENKKIYLGLAGPDEESEPLVMYTNHEETIDKLQKQIDTLTEMVESAFASAVGNVGAPIVYTDPLVAALGAPAAAPVITKANEVLKNRVNELNVPAQHSGKVFLDPQRGPK